jgi:alkylation response protein AidB-like acyl-CoA dehydrogenase
VIDLRPEPDQLEFGRSLQTVVERHGGDSQLSSGLWPALADVGLLGLCSADAGGDASDLAVAMEALGRALCPGPVVATVAASAILSGDDLEAVASGRQRITFTDGDVIPWLSADTTVLALIGDEVWTVEVSQARPVDTLCGDAWHRAVCRPAEYVGAAAHLSFLAQVGLAAYLIGAASKLLGMAAEHARSRVQFGRPIGDFQAVAHPLARSKAELAAAWDLVRITSRLDGDSADPGLATASLRQARRAGCTAAERSHQVFGAYGFATETGVSIVSTRIRQSAVLPVLYRTKKYPAEV